MYGYVPQTNQAFAIQQCGVCHNSIGSISISQHDIAAENRTTQVNSGMSFGTIDTQVFINTKACVHV